MPKSINADPRAWLSKSFEPDFSTNTLPIQNFTERELRRCQCCHPVASRTIITLHAGREQFTCPKTRITMRYAEMRGDGGYLAGGLVLP